MGMNFQDVIRDVHDPANHQLKVNSSAAGSSTVYVGTPTLYAVVNTGGANTGNMTLNPSPNFIGIVTVANPGSLNGNLTLDKGSVTGIVDGADPTIKATVFDMNSSNPIAVQIVDNDGETFMQDKVLPTMLVDSAANEVGISSSPVYVRHVGNVTLDAGSLTGIKGNVTLSDAKTFVGLVTVKASILDTYASLATFTMSLASLATSVVGVGRQSTLEDNTTTNYISANVYLKVFSGGLAHTANSLVNVYLIRGDNNSVADDGAGASDAALTVINAPFLGNILFNSSLISTSYQAVFDTSPLGPLGPKWGIAVVNQTGAALGGTEGNHLKNYIGITRRLT